MTGYEKSDDYGGPPGSWRGIAVWIVLLIVLAVAYRFFTTGSW